MTPEEKAREIFDEMSREALIAEVERLREALMFYAEGFHYKIDDDGDVDIEVGDTARAALGLSEFPSQEDK